MGARFWLTPIGETHDVDAVANGLVDLAANVFHGLFQPGGAGGRGEQDGHGGGLESPGRSRCLSLANSSLVRIGI